MVPRENLPYPLTNDEFGDPVKVVTIPLPVIASSPNEGIIYGALTAFLLHNKMDEVSTLVAPQINFNKNFGTTLSLFGAFYPSPDRNWEFNLSRSTKVNEDYEIKFRDRTLLDKKLEMNAFVFAYTDGSARFFGFQSDSAKENETNYGDREIGFTFSAGYEIFDHLQLVFGERFKDVTIKRGAVTSVPFIRDRFTAGQVPGIDGFTAHAQKLSLVYNTLDSRDMATRGLYAKAAIEGSAKALGSSDDYRHYEAEVKGYFPLDNSRYITVARLAYNQTMGSGVPFLERSVLGGETTLRGYGRYRFIDSSFFLCNLEERIRLFRWAVFNVNTDWEAAPFIDLGAVMASLDKASSRNFEFNPGIGFRAVVRPNIVGRVDIGVGKDGPQVFVGLGYPF
jgi:outer membrane protein assembly factor BamA